MEWCRSDRNKGCYSDFSLTMLNACLIELNQANQSIKLFCLIFEGLLPFLAMKKFDGHPLVSIKFNSTIGQVTAALDLRFEGVHFED